MSFPTTPDILQFGFINEQQRTPCHIECPLLENPRNSEIDMPKVLRKEITSNIFKTRLCAKFGLGNCPYGYKCTFAHGIDDLQRTPDFYKMKLCRKHLKGERCPYGNRCKFDHDRETSRFKPDPVFWKTRLCNKWGATGDCSYKEGCIFAHGEAELRKFGSNTALESGNRHSSSSEPLPSAIYALPSKTKSRTTYQLQVQRKNCSFKWRRPGKISGIYADWIDDIPLERTEASNFFNR